METLIQFLKHTPIWVYVIFVYFLVQGISALKPRSASVGSVFIMPIVLTLIVWWLGSSMWFSLWLLGACIGGWISWRRIKSLPIHVDVRKRTIKLPGSPFPLILFLSIFALKYTFGALEVVAPESYLKIIPYQSLLTGLLIGFCWGRAMSIWRIFQHEVKAIY